MRYVIIRLHHHERNFFTGNVDFAVDYPLKIFADFCILDYPYKGFLRINK